MRSSGSKLMTLAVPRDSEGAEMRTAVGMILLAIAGSLLISAYARAEGDEAKAKEYDARLKAARSAAALQSALDNAATPEARAAAKKALGDAKNKDQSKQDLANFKQKTMDNLANIKELFAKAEDSWKNKLYGDAAPIYNSVVMATVPGAEDMVETSRGRMVELEDMAKTHLKNADDCDLKRDYVKEVEELAIVHHDFTLTKSYEVALRRLVNLKSRPEVSGYVELAQAEGLESDGKLTEAVKLYEAICNNPRYDNSVASLKARRHLDELSKNDDTRAKLKSEVDAKADREAPVLLNSAKNFASNNMPKQALEKLQMIVEKFPNSKYADEAKKQMAGLK
jgi:hypothetical protein